MSQVILSASLSHQASPFNLVGMMAWKFYADLRWYTVTGYYFFLSPHSLGHIGQAVGVSGPLFFFVC